MADQTALTNALAELHAASDYCGSAELNEAEVHALCTLLRELDTANQLPWPTRETS